MAGRIKMPLDMEVGLRPSHIMLDGGLGLLCQMETQLALP